MKNIKLILTYLFIAMLLIACEEKEEIMEGLFLEGKSSYSLSEFDDLTTTVEINKASSITELSVKLIAGEKADGESLAQKDLGKITSTEAAFTFTSTLDNLGVLKSEAWVDIFFEGVDADGNVFGKKVEVNVYAPIEIDNSIMVREEDKVQYLNYSTTTNEATISSASVDYKVSKDGAWANIASPPAGGSWSTAADSIPVNGADFALNDTVYYRVTATSGSKTSSLETYVVIKTLNFDTETKRVQLLNTVSYNVVGDSISKADTTADLMLTVVNGNELSISSDNGAEFVLSDSSTYSENNMAKAKVDFDAGTPITTIPDVEIGHVYIFKVVRTEKEYLGIFKITDLYRTNNDLKDSLELSYRLGEI